jgi:hypothetical protein
VKLKALASWIFLYFTSFWRNSAVVFSRYIGVLY